MRTRLALALVTILAVLTTGIRLPLPATAAAQGVASRAAATAASAFRSPVAPTSRARGRFHGMRPSREARRT